MPDQAEGETALRAIEREWNAAALHWDPAGLAALYTDDAVFYGGRVGHSVGRARVREYFESYVGTLASVRLALVDQELRELGERVWLAQGYAAFEFNLSAGGTAKSVLRSTLILTRRVEGWRILQHHFSATPSEPPIPAAD